MGSLNSSTQLPQRPSLADQRRAAILNVGQADFDVAPDPAVADAAPWYEKPKKNKVSKYEGIIEREAKTAHADPDLLKAIMYIETTHGYYDSAANSLGLNKSILPMNINVDYWRNLGYTREQLEEPELNIRAGATLLRGIQSHMPDADVDQVATVYNSLGAKKVSPYGARVAEIYRKKLWEK